MVQPRVGRLTRRPDHPNVASPPMGNVPMMLRAPRFVLPLLLLLPLSAHAVVIRDDVDDAEYRITEAEIEALVDMPHEGHGVLIAPQWILTAAHVVASGHAIDEVML